MYVVLRVHVEEATKRSGWKADYASRMQSSLVTPHEVLLVCLCMVVAYSESVGNIYDHDLIVCVKV